MAAAKSLTVAQSSCSAQDLLTTLHEAQCIISNQQNYISILQGELSVIQGQLEDEINRNEQLRQQARKRNARRGQSAKNVKAQLRQSENLVKQLEKTRQAHVRTDQQVSEERATSNLLRTQLRVMAEKVFSAQERMKVAGDHTALMSRSVHGPELDFFKAQWNARDPDGWCHPDHQWTHATGCSKLVCRDCCSHDVLDGNTGVVLDCGHCRREYCGIFELPLPIRPPVIRNIRRLFCLIDGQCEQLAAILNESHRVLIGDQSEPHDEHSNGLRHGNDNTEPIGDAVLIELISDDGRSSESSLRRQCHNDAKRVDME